MTDSIKVLILIPCLNIGGTEMQTLSLSRVLRSCGHAVVVVCYFEQEKSMVGEFQKEGVEVRLLEMNRNSGVYGILTKLRKEIRIINPDVVHVQYMAPGALPIIAARLAGVKKVFATVHQPWTPAHGKLSKFILRTASLLCTRFIAVSVIAEKSWFGSGELFDANKPVKLQPRHFTIHNSVDAELIQNISSSVNVDLLKNNLYIPIDIPVIGAVSRLRHEKGIDLLIESFKQLIAGGTEAHLFIVGTGPDEVTLKEKTQIFGIRSSVTFYGEADWETAMNLLIIMDIVVVPSRFEGFGLTALEAMAAGKPVVANNTGGLAEIIRDKKTGLLINTEDTHLLMTSIQYLIRNKIIANELSNNARLEALTKFSYSRYAALIANLYEISLECNH